MNHNEIQLLILDKDGTLVTPGSGETFPQSPWDQLIMPGVLHMVRSHHKLGGYAVIASNQGGVASGHKTIDETVEEMHHCMKLFEGMIKVALFCPDYEGDSIYVVDHGQVGYQRIHSYDARKPGAGMLSHAMSICSHGTKNEVKIFPGNVMMVGDRLEDEQSAKAAGVNFMHAEKFHEYGKNTEMFGNWMSAAGTSLPDDASRA